MSLARPASAGFLRSLARAALVLLAAGCSLKRSPALYTVNGSVSGLWGSLVLQLDGANDITVSSNNTFAFPPVLPTGTPYTITVLTQPPGQTCAVINGQGVVGAGGVTGISVICTDNPYAVGGTVAGLTGTAVLQDNGGDDLPVSANGAFVFATRLPRGTAYAVTVRTQPVGQTCRVAGDKGVVAAADITAITITCAVNTYTIGGTVSGMIGSLTLQNNSGDDLPVGTNGPFTFAKRLTHGATYSVAVSRPPATQSCKLQGASGLATSDVTTVVITCTNLPPVASAGTIQPALVGQAIALPGSFVDVAGDPVAVSWTQTAGPLTVALDNPTSATPSFIPRGAGNYAFSITAKSATGQSSANTSVAIHDINGGDEFSLAVKPDGTVWAWGFNGTGQLGNPGVTTNSAVPVRVCDAGASDCGAHPLTGVVAIGTGATHSLALKADGTVWSWGQNSYGQLGNGDPGFANATTPVQVCAVGETNQPCQKFLTGVVAIAAGYLFSSALLSNGAVVTWGQGIHGELGNGVQINQQAIPVEVCAETETMPPASTCTAANGNILTGVKTLASGGGGHTLAIKTNGQLIGWGENKNGQVGVGLGYQQGYLNQGHVYIPAQVCDAGGVNPCTSFLSNVASIDAWSALSLALKSDGTLWAWGHNDYNQLAFDHPGTAQPNCQNGSCEKVPVQVCANDTSPCTRPLTNVAIAKAGRRYGLALKKDGTAWAWGDNSNGNLGNGTIGNPTPGPVATPAQVCAEGASSPCAAFLSSVAAISTGSQHSFALKSDGTLWAWGYNGQGQLGTGVAAGTDGAIPAQVY